jgi:hypothetical protein
MRVCFILFLLTAKIANAQIDSAMAVPLVGINFGGQVPMADMAKRFGPNLRAGGSFLYKTKKNWLLGFEANYMFGKNVREDVVAPLKTTDGFVVDNEGYPADLRVTERGITVIGLLGKVIPIGGSNPNSGLMVCIGAGYMQHKANLYDAQQKIAAVKGDLKKGYDHLTGGFATHQFIGYLYLGENKLLNFYAGIECYQGYTHSLRKISYTTGLPDLANRFDLLTGLRVGWILPLYERKPNDSYYY